MPNKLHGKTMILTGSTVVTSVQQLIESHGGAVKHFPLIETVEKVNAEDEQYLKKLSTYDWLIFTSQNAVSNFLTKCMRHHFPLSEVKSKIIAVGEKTAKQLNDAKLSVDFIPTTYSADVLVKEFHLGEGEQALFVRGSMAKSTIRDALGADEWTVYETKESITYATELEQCILSSADPIVLFASPSAVEVFAKEIAPIIDWSYVKVASIGHVTTAALAKYGVTPYIQPTTYTMQAVIEQLILEEQTK